MGNFLNDPEAQRRYQERFGKPTPADNVDLFTDPEAQQAYEASGFKETPGVSYANRETFDETMRRAREAQHGPALPSEAFEFPETSGHFSFLSARLSNQPDDLGYGGITAGDAERFLREAEEELEAEEADELGSL